MNLLARLITAAFFIISSLNTIKDLDKNAEKFTQKYKTFQKQTEELIGTNFDKNIDHSTVSGLSSSIILYISYGVMTFAILSLLTGRFGQLAAWVWLTTQLLEHEVMGMVRKRDLGKIQTLSMILAVFVSLMVLNSTSKKCVASGNCSSKSSEKSVKTN